MPWPMIPTFWHDKATLTAVGPEALYAAIKAVIIATGYPRDEKGPRELVASGKANIGKLASTRRPFFVTKLT